ncbi:MAG: DUF4382 domain-containing protein [Deltaproteobacteria bacterium]|nr:DUF4382 domain-containing protein [Deltaproteobacteria bacterium]
MVALLGISVLTPGAAPLSAGTLEVRVKDHRDAIDDFSKLEIVVDRVRISSKAGAKFWQIGWKDLSPTLDKVDLTKYTGKRSAAVFRGEVAQGSFEGIHLKLREVEGVLKKTKSKVALKNAITPIQLAFSIDSKGETLVVLDLTVLDMSDHSGGGYELHLRGYELYRDGKLLDKVPPG